MYYAYYSRYGVRTIGGGKFLAFDTKKERDEFVNKYWHNSQNVVCEACSRKEVEKYLGRNFGYNAENWEIGYNNYVFIKICFTNKWH